MNQRTFFTLFPKGYWVCIASGLIFSFFPEVSRLSTFVFATGAFLLAFRIAIIIHEIGHLLAAKIAGGIPRRMVIGKGHELYRIICLGVPVVINSEFRGAFAQASFHEGGNLRLRYGFYVMGGVLLNIAVGLIFYMLFEIDPEKLSMRPLSIIPFTIFLANLLTLLALVPYRATVQGVRMPTDGLALLQLPFTKDHEIRSRLDVERLITAHAYLERKDYVAAREIYISYLELYPESRIQSLNLAFTWLKTGELEKCYQIAEELLNVIDSKQIKPYTALIYNLAAWTCLVMKKHEEADEYSRLALKSAPNDNNIRGTRGSVLVERGNYHDGVRLLFHNMDFQLVNNATLGAAIFLMLAYDHKGLPADSDKYRAFIDSNANKLDFDEKILFERCLSRMGRERMK